MEVDWALRFERISSVFADYVNEFRVKFRLFYELPTSLSVPLEEKIFA